MTNPVDMQTKQLRLIRLQTVFLIGIFLVIAVVGVSVVTEMLSMRRFTELLGQNIQSLEPETLNRAVEAFSDAAEQFGRIDAEELNQTLVSLRETAEKLKGMDMEKLGEMAESIESAAARLQSAISAIAGIFGR